MKRQRRRKCIHCNLLYHPIPCAAYHQCYCAKPECQKASHAASQRRWLNKPENRGYFSGPEQVARVQQYWKTHPRPPRKARDGPDALQDELKSQPIDDKVDKTSLIPAALQDDFLLQPAVLLGVIYSLSGCALQEDMARRVQQYHTRGQMILNMVCGTSGEQVHDYKASVATGTVAQGP
jgi:hypothetical protein